MNRSLDAHEPVAGEEIVPTPALFRPRATRSELIARGKALRARCPRGSHATWQPPADRPDPVHLIEVGNQGRLPELIPLRHGRMVHSPFTFFRGAALHMAVDLAGTPVSGPRVQACGDAHLGNFRGFGTPERRVIFDIHDLDETLPAPWEWDVKRLAASVVLASRDNGLGEEQAREAVLIAVAAYRRQMAEFSQMRALDIWYHRFEARKLIAEIEDKGLREKTRQTLDDVINVCIVEDVFPKLADASGDTPRIQDNPPFLYHQLRQGEQEFYERIEDVMARYRASLPEGRRVLLDRYAVKDKAIKVVGVGSVGTVCSIVLLMAGKRDPLFLQVKEARPSVLAAYAGASAYAHQGQRVVQGHRLMQSASDIFLGWTQDGAGRHFYVRQLRDKKLKFRVEQFKAAKMKIFAGWCGRTLARAHARTGEPALIYGYLGKADTFDRAIAEFATAYADQSERDHAELARAVREGRLRAESETRG